MDQRGVRRAAAVACSLLLAIGALLVWTPAAGAASTYVIVFDDLNGFRPDAITVPYGSKVQWQNNGATEVDIASAKGCSFQLTVAPFTTSGTRTLKRAGTCSYTGTTLLGKQSGTITVRAPKHKPTPSRTTTRPSPTATTGPRPTGSSGPVVVPPTGSPTPSQTATPQPTVTETPRITVPDMTVVDGSLVKGKRTDGVSAASSSARERGLPIALSGLLLAGVISGIARLLLREPVAVRPSP